MAKVKIDIIKGLLPSSTQHVNTEGDNPQGAITGLWPLGVLLNAPQYIPKYLKRGEKCIHKVKGIIVLDLKTAQLADNITLRRHFIVLWIHEDRCSWSRNFVRHCDSQTQQIMNNWGRIWLSFNARKLWGISGDETILKKNDSWSMQWPKI